MLNDYKVQEENRQKVAETTYEFYNTVNLPGTRTFDPISKKTWKNTWRNLRSDGRN